MENEHARSLSLRSMATLRLAFETQDFELATKAALKAYGLNKLPKLAEVAG